MARPHIHDDARRALIIRVRVTLAEKTRLDEIAKSAGLTLSDYVRTKAINSAPMIRKATPEREALIRGLAELGKIGSNVNQIARGINRQLAGGREPHIPNEVINHSLNGLDVLTYHLVEILEHGH